MNSTKVNFKDAKEVVPNTYKFTLTPTHVAYANTLRRLILTGVETIAFRADMTSKGTTTDVSVRANTTPMTNEMLAHRIGLLPIHVKEPLKWDPERFIFRLNVKGDKMNIKDIYASDFTISEIKATEDVPVPVPSETFFPPDPVTRETCLIATLYPGESQTIDIIAKPTIGTGRENARFQPVSQCSYEYTRDTDEVRQEDIFRQWLADAKKVDFETLKKDERAFDAYKREFNTMEVARCYLQDERTGEPYSYDFTVESVGTLEVPYIIQRACEVGEAMVARYSNIDKDDLPAEITVSPADSRIIGFDFLIRGHDHTFGNLLQTYLEQNHIDGKGETKITFAGYVVPHPLRDEMILRIGVEDGQEHTARKAFAEACRGCVVLFRDMRTAWMRAMGIAEPVAKPAITLAPAPATKPKSIAIQRKKPTGK